MDASPSRVVRAFLLGGTALFAFVGFLLYVLWASGPNPGSFIEPYENYLLYNQHYDWVQSPFLQAFRAASIFAVCLGVFEVTSRRALSWRVWLPWVAFALTVQVAVFNIVVDDMTGTNWLFSAYLVMSWFEPWLMVTLGSVSAGFYSTGGVAFAALIASTSLLFVIRRERGLSTALIEALLFLSAALLLFEVGIAEYRPFWWSRQVTDFQFTIGASWLTNQILYSVAASSTALLGVLRVFSRRSSRQVPLRGGSKA